MKKLTIDYTIFRRSDSLKSLMEDVTANDYKIGYFQNIYDLPYSHPDLSYKLEAKEWITLLEHAWKFVYTAAMEDGHISETEKMDLNNIHKLRNFYSAQLRSGKKLMLHHNFVKKVHSVKELDYNNESEDLSKRYNPKPEKSINNVNSPYYVPKPWELGMHPRLNPNS